MEVKSEHLSPSYCANGKWSIYTLGESASYVRAIFFGVLQASRYRFYSRCSLRMDSKLPDPGCQTVNELCTCGCLPCTAVLY